MRLFQTGSLLVAAIALIGAVGLSVQSAQAASKVYPFTARGTISDFDEGGLTFKVDITAVDQKRASTDMNGNNIQITIDPKAVVVKNANGKDTRVTYHNLAIGQQVAFKGFKMNDDTYLMNFARITDRSFTVVGNLESYNSTADTLKILVVSSTYQPSKYAKKNIQVSMVFKDDASTFYSRSGNKYVAVSKSDINADAQKVKATGYISGTNTWNVTKMWSNYKGN